MNQLTESWFPAMRLTKIATTVAAASLLIITAACSPLPDNQDSLPGSGSAPKNDAVVETVDTSSISAFKETIPTCADIGGAISPIVGDMQPKPSDFERRGLSSGLEKLSCNWANAAFVNKGEGKATIGVTIAAAQINPEAYEGNTEGAADLAIADAGETGGSKSFSIEGPLTLTDVVPKSGVVTVFSGATITTTVSADEGAEDAPTVEEVVNAHSQIARFIGLK